MQYSETVHSPVRTEDARIFKSVLTMSVLTGTFDFKYEQVRIFLQCFNFFALLFHVLKLEMAKRQG